MCAAYLRCIQMVSQVHGSARPVAAQSVHVEAGLQSVGSRQRKHQAEASGAAVGKGIEWQAGETANRRGSTAGTRAG